MVIKLSFSAEMGRKRRWYGERKYIALMIIRKMVIRERKEEKMFWPRDILAAIDAK